MMSCDSAILMSFLSIVSILLLRCVSYVCSDNIRNGRFDKISLIASNKLYDLIGPTEWDNDSLRIWYERLRGFFPDFVAMQIVAHRWEWWLKFSWHEDVIMSDDELISRTVMSIQKPLALTTSWVSTPAISIIVRISRLFLDKVTL